MVHLPALITLQQVRDIWERLTSLLFNQEKKLVVNCLRFNRLRIWWVAHICLALTRVWGCRQFKEELESQENRWVMSKPEHRLPWCRIIQESKDSDSNSLVAKEFQRFKRTRTMLKILEKNQLKLFLSKRIQRLAQGSCRQMELNKC